MVQHLASFLSTHTSPFSFTYLMKPPPTWVASSFSTHRNIQHSHLCWIYALAIKSCQRQAFVPSVDDKDLRNIHHSHLCWIYALAIKSSQRQAFVPSIYDKDSRHVERSFDIFKVKNIRRNDMQTQIDVIIATFTLHSYIRNSDEENMTFTMIEQHPNYISSDELHDVHGHETDTEKSLNEHLMR
uniref:Uncharacterized protein n=1 Tax=Tanacetum cinerariifolium TaxID=118510 RepID=A0A699JID3_TANCI|nr:hypothetical protein [Tanacetum cinerariifolium]